MPYIVKEDRPQYDKVLDELIELLKKNPPEAIDGHLNYVVTKIIKGIYTKLKLIQYQSPLYL